MSTREESDSKWQPRVPYNALPLLPPKIELETRLVLKACIGARAALAELKRISELIPNPLILITLPMLETQASNEIENIVTTTDKLFQYSPGDANLDESTKEAFRYREALYQGMGAIGRRPLSTGTAESICSTIKGIEMRVRRGEGTALGNDSVGVIYTPPVGETHLRNLLANWERFLHEEQHLDPLVRLAVAHYQFEAIRPFTDGNGRTGRVLNSLFIVQEDLLTRPILYLSRYILEHKREYYRRLLAVTEDGDWESWILFILAAIEETSVWTGDKVTAIMKLLDHTIEFVSEHEPKLSRLDLMYLLFELPYLRIDDVKKLEGTVRQTASNRLKKLVSIGVLEEISIGREKLFFHRKLLDLLNSSTGEFEPYSIPS